MRNSWSIFFLLLIVATTLFAQPMPQGKPLINWSDQGPWMGFSSTGQSVIPGFEFGIEQIENGKVSTFRKQRWYLSCMGSTNEDTVCDLERLVIDPGLKLFPTGDADPAFPTITVHKHSTSDGTLENLKVDWDAGKLDFDVVYPHGAPTVVGIRFARNGNSIYLSDFRGAAAFRGVISQEVAAVQYRIPRYSSVVHVPIELAGYNSLEEQEWDEMISTMSPSDQARWKAIRMDPNNRPTIDDPEAKRAFQEAIIAAIPEAADAIRQGLDQLPEGIDEERAFLAMDGAILPVFKVWLKQSGLSDPARRKIMEFLNERLAPGGVMMSLLDAATGDN